MANGETEESVRREDYYQHIDMGFLNRRLCLSALPPDVRTLYQRDMKPGEDHFTVLANDHRLVTILLDLCDALKAPTLLEALARGAPRSLFRSTERLAPCPEIYEAARARHAVRCDVDFGKPVEIAYHTEHLVSSTGKMTLAEGADRGYVQAMVGLLHDRGDRFEIEPLVVGAPTLEHPRNQGSQMLAWMGRDYGELLPEDIEQFTKMETVEVVGADQWMDTMSKLPEARVKEAFAHLLADPSKKDWGGESNDHFSANVSVAGRRKTAAFLLKGPSKFREMTLDMCGARADQIYRLTNSGADISVVQHSHQIGEAVRGTLRALTVHPGRARRFCVIDGLATYRILKAYNLLPGA
jgi:hypothetical protein